MDKVDYYNIIALNVRDDPKNFVESTTITSKSLLGGETTFIVDSVVGFFPGDRIYMKDSALLVFDVIRDVVEAENKIKITGDLMAIATGTQIKKNDAEQYLLNSMVTYSKFRPLTKSQEYLALDVVNEIDLPIDWMDGFSSISNIRYPLIATSIVFINDQYYTVGLNSAGVKKVLLAFTISGDARIIYTASHGFDTVGIPENPPDPAVPPTYLSTAPDYDAYCICDLASAYYFLALAARFSQVTNMDSLGAGVLNYETKPDEYMRLYDLYLSKAASHLGIDVEELKKGSSVLDGATQYQQIDETIYDDNILIRSNYFINY